ncbi:MAG: SUMF1/EgtB/PvdO family nonheme iron enzyme [Lentimonas sp.]
MKTKLKLLIPTLSLLFFGAYSVHATLPVVSNISATQRASTKLVDISYDVADADGDLLKIRIEVSDNAGTEYSIPAFSLTGDIGDDVAPGTGKLIVWDAGVDWDGEYSDQMRVKVIAVDARGFPGLEWGNEVPAGGFLMGQDGGVEGTGPSRHVNIPWSYWLSKYEITVEQYCEFLNTALVAGEVYRNGTTYVLASDGAFIGVPAGASLLRIGDSYDIAWNVNNFEVVLGQETLPVGVTWYGAIAFAQHYGYDLPTRAEWEKAARGPDHDDQDEHQLYPWGDTITTGHGNFYNSGDPFDGYPYDTKTPVGYYDGNQTPLGPDTVNAHGLYDLVGNAGEWTRTIVTAVESYSQEEDLNAGHNSLLSTADRFFKGGVYDLSKYTYSSAYHKLYYWRDWDLGGYDKEIGFRVIRRSLP